MVFFSEFYFYDIKYFFSILNTSNWHKLKKKKQSKPFPVSAPLL